MHYEPFDTIAQVAAAFAGFVGVVLAIRSRGGALPRLQMTGFLQTSLGAVAFALLPELVVKLLPNEKISWQLLCGLFARAVTALSTSINSIYQPNEAGLRRCLITLGEVMIPEDVLNDSFAERDDEAKNISYAMLVSTVEIIKGQIA